jgi:HD-GYP domain-containing protein (c-di-GMP phosphodiesterase class II)
MDNRPESATAPSLGVHPGILGPATCPPFDRYVLERDGGSFRLFQRANDPVYANIHARLEEAGADVIYLRGQDQEACLDYVEQHLSEVTEDGVLPAGQAAEWVYRLACRAMEELLADPDRAERYARLESLVGAITQASVRHPGGQWRMLECAPLKHKTNSHSINVAVLLTGFARSVMRVNDRKVLTEVALGGALHDLGKTRVPAAILDKPAALTSTEFAEVKKHPRYGLDIARPYLHKGNIARHIIAQHHENVCGNGYPEGRSGQSIDIFARVARVVDVFDALTSNRPYSTAVDTFSALNQMVVEMRPQFDMPILRKFIRYLSNDWDRDPPVSVALEPAVQAADSLPAILMGPPLRDEKAEAAAVDEPVEEPHAAEAPQAAEGPEVECYPADEATVAFTLPGSPAAERDLEEERRAAAKERALAEQRLEEERYVATIQRRIEAVPLPVNGGGVQSSRQQGVERSTLEAAKEGTANVERETLDAVAVNAVSPPPARPPMPVAEVADLDARLEKIQEMCDWQDGTSALMNGIMRALGDAVANLPPRGAQTAASAPFAAQQPAQPQRGPSAVDAARKLFPLIWEIDEWRRTFAAGSDASPLSSRMRAETLACLAAVRQGAVDVLRSYHVSVIESAESYDPALHTVAGRIPTVGASSAAAHVQRVGFMHSLGDTYEVVEPALVMLRVDKRQAG